MEIDNGISSLLVIRADANTRIGTGHLMRCLALAQAWQANEGQVTFITACDSEALVSRLLAEGFEVNLLNCAYPDPADWENTTALLAAHPEAWVVLDGYHFDTAYHRQIREVGHPLLVIDDTAHLEYYHADIILNQNIESQTLNYCCDPTTTQLLGTQYVLLRREFWPWQNWQRQIPRVARNVLVTLGGGDPDNQTLKVIQALHQVAIDGLEAVVVVGASNPHWAELEFIVRNSPLAIRLVYNVTNMPELMAWADVAVSAGGSTCWELAFMGLPTLILVIADNQRKIAAGLDLFGMAVNLGWFETVSVHSIAEKLAIIINTADQRSRMRQQAISLVAGDGADKVTEMAKNIKMLQAQPG